MRRMRLLGLKNFVYILPLAAFLIMLMGFLRLHNLGAIKRGEIKYLSEKQDLIQVLRKATMPDRTVILTMVDESYAKPGSMLEVLVQSFKSGQGTQRLLNHLVIITMDPQAYEYCTFLHPYCIHPSTFQPYFSNNVFTWRRNNVLIEVIDLGYNIIFTNTDVLWLKSPLTNFNSEDEISISCNFTSDGETTNSIQEGGVFYMRANEIALEFLRHWKLIKILYPDSNVEESMCETVTENELVDSYNFRVHQVDANHFGGLCKLNDDMLEELYTIHANCCDDITSKVHDLRNVLDDWTRFRNRVKHDNATEKMASSWPVKCTR